MASFGVTYMKIAGFTKRVATGLPGFTKTRNLEATGHVAMDGQG